MTAGLSEPADPSSAVSRSENVLVDPETVILGIFEDETLPSAHPGTSSSSQRAAPAISNAPSARRLVLNRASGSTSPTMTSPVSPTPRGSCTSTASAPSRIHAITASMADEPSALTSPRTVPLPLPGSRGRQRLAPVLTNVAAGANSHSPMMPATPTPTTAAAAIDFSGQALISHYRTFVRGHLLQIHHGAVANEADAPDALEQFAAGFSPVRADNRCLTDLLIAGKLLLPTAPDRAFLGFLETSCGFLINVA